MMRRSAGQDGFALLALIVAIFVILLFLGIAAPQVARDLRRERELEAVHRGNQYVRAIQLYYRKFQRYPGSMEQLEKSNNIRFLRKQYDDPFTGKPDWRLIHVGEAKTTVKGFFGKPLAGLPTAGIGSGSTAGGSFGGTSGTGGSSFGSTANPTGSGTSSFGGSGSSSFGTPGASGTAGAGGGLGTSSAGGSGTGALGGGIGSQNATDFKGTGGPFVGIGLSKAGESILTLNEQTQYSTWEFIYDPRIEALKAKSSLFGGGAATSATSNSLSTFGSSTGTGPTGGNATTGANGPSGPAGSGVVPAPAPVTAPAPQP